MQAICLPTDIPPSSMRPSRPEAHRHFYSPFAESDAPPGRWFARDFTNNKKSASDLCRICGTTYLL